MSLYNKTHIPIFFSVDDAYVPYLAAALQSLEDNASSEYDYDIYILTTGVKKENSRLVLGMERENVHIEFVNVREKKDGICGGLSLRDYYTEATYYRLLIPSLFPDIGRGIYLDCDVVLTGDISELYFSETDGALVGAVTDDVVPSNEVFGSYVKNVLSLEPGEYFNAGVLVMELERMRKEGFLSQFLSLRSERSFPVAQDQDYLNVLCRGRVRFLDGAWNKTPFALSPLGTPKLIHFKLDLRPWRYDGVPYGDLFWKYAEKTPFADVLRSEKKKYTDKERANDREQGEKLLALAKTETKKAVGMKKEA